MINLCPDTDAGFGKLYNTANTLFDFTAESTAFTEGDGYNIIDNSAFTASNITALIELDDDDGLEIINSISQYGELRSGALVTVVGKTYEFTYTN